MSEPGEIGGKAPHVAVAKLEALSQVCVYLPRVSGRVLCCWCCRYGKEILVFTNILTSFPTQGQEQWGPAASLLSYLCKGTF
jgi:hypothetical protein